MKNLRSFWRGLLFKARLHRNQKAKDADTKKNSSKNRCRRCLSYCEDVERVKLPVPSPCWMNALCVLCWDDVGREERLVWYLDQSSEEGERHKWRDGVLERKVLRAQIMKGSIFAFIEPAVEVFADETGGNFTLAQIWVHELHEAVERRRRCTK